MVSADTSSRRGHRGLRVAAAAAAGGRDAGPGRAAAAELFAERGYAGTTMPEIGRRAGVSTETVQNHGPKVELLRAAIAAVSFGAGPGAAVADTELGRPAAGRPAARRRRPGCSAEVLATVNERSHGVWMAFSEASRNDEVLSPELRRLTERDRGADARSCSSSGGPGAGSARTCRCPSWSGGPRAIGSVELWDRIVRVEGHSPEAYRELVAGLLLDALTSVRGRGR